MVHSIASVFPFPGPPTSRTILGEVEASVGSLLAQSWRRDRRFVRSSCLFGWPLFSSRSRFTPPPGVMAGPVDERGRVLHPFQLGAIHSPRLLCNQAMAIIFSSSSRSTCWLASITASSSIALIAMPTARAKYGGTALPTWV